MILIQQTSTNPYFNIAAEEYLLKNSSEDYFILYRNDPAIIVGKHQNTIAEINLSFVRQKGLAIVRRLSGGGAVYHDLGNLNYSFIINGSEGNLVDFKKYTQPIIDVLQGVRVDAKIGSKNDIRVGDKKISGNAEHVYRNRVLHHGTLLFSSNLDDLNEALKIKLNVYIDKAVKSIRSDVANISDYLIEILTMEEFAHLIFNHLIKLFPNSQINILANDEVDSINSLVQTKYSTWEWNYGYSPLYTLNKQVYIGSKMLNIQANVDKGIISHIIIYTDFLNRSKAAEIEQLLKGCRHEVDEISSRLSSVDLNDYIPGISLKHFLAGLF